MRMIFRDEVRAHVPAVHGGVYGGVRIRGTRHSRADDPVNSGTQGSRRGGVSRDVYNNMCAISATGRRVLDFSSSITPAGIPDRVKSIRLDPGRMSRYPDPHSQRLVRDMARHVGLDEANIIMGNGAVEIIYNYCVLLRPNTRVLIQAPTFDEYEKAAGLAGCRPSFFESMDLGREISDFISRIPRKGCVFVCNPNNPTGALLSQEQVLDIVRVAGARSSAVFVDECFIELVPGRCESVISQVAHHDNLLVLRSLTKSFGLAGIRIGYAAAPPYVISALGRIRIPWSVNAIAQQAGLAAIKSRTHIKSSHEIISREYEFLYNSINAIPGMQCYESATNFILVRTRRNSATLQRDLLQHGILVRNCSSFRNMDTHHIRISIRGRRDNLRLVRALRAES